MVCLEHSSIFQQDGLACLERSSICQQDRMAGLDFIKLAQSTSRMGLIDGLHRSPISNHDGILVLDTSSHG